MYALAGFDRRSTYLMFTRGSVMGPEPILLGLLALV